MKPPVDGTVLVTGASSGIGGALARQLARTASRLILVARRETRLHALASELRGQHPSLQVDVVPCDLADVDAVDALTAAIGDTVDVLVNNAGVGDLGLFVDADPDRLQAMIGVNVVGLTRLTAHCVPPMVARGRGGVLNIGSNHGLTWTPGAAAYVGTKHFVHGFSEALRSEVQPLGVVVTEVCPGPVATEFEERAGGFFGLDAPSFVFLTAETVARRALVGFVRGRALVVPSFDMRVAALAYKLAPRWAVRLALRPMSWWMRRRSRAQETA